MIQSQRDELIKKFNDFSALRDKEYGGKKNYYARVLKTVKKFIPAGKSVLEIGCGTGSLLAGLSPGRGVGVDFSPAAVDIAREKYREFVFIVCDAENLPGLEKFDFVVFSDTTIFFTDIWKVFQQVRKSCHLDSRLVVTNCSFWSEKISGLFKAGPQPVNRVSLSDLKDLLFLSDFELVESRQYFSLSYLIAKPLSESQVKKFSCSVIVPTRNEAGNIEGCVEGIPDMGSFTEIIFVDGASTDGTVEKIKEMQEKHSGKKNISLIHQRAADKDQNPDRMLEAGKGDAVRKGFDAACGDILMILDSDLTVAPEDLPKFYYALAQGKADFTNGTRLVYPREDGAMRFLNYVGNKFFSAVFTCLLKQRITDTLCGTKVLFKKDYEKIRENRSYFGDFDPFGDFDLLFGAAKLGLKMVDIAVRYRSRTYGNIKIERFKHGLILLRMSFIGFKKLKLKI